LKYSKKIVLLVIILNVVFAAAVLFLSGGDHQVPDSLIVAWYAFTGGELLGVAGIKISEIRKGDKNDEI
jgi:hypothetical protein